MQSLKLFLCITTFLLYYHLSSVLTRYWDFLSHQQAKWAQGLVINWSPIQYFKNNTTPKIQGGTQLILDTMASCGSKWQTLLHSVLSASVLNLLLKEFHSIS